MVISKPGLQALPSGAASGLRLRVDATRQFSTVYAEKEPDGPGRVKVIFHLRDLPSVIRTVTYRGAVALSRKDLDTITGIRVGMPLNPMFTRTACQQIVTRYNQDGRPFATCKLLQGDIASIFAGALSPLIAVGLMTAYKPETWPISAYMIALALITIVSVYFATETRRDP